MQRRILFAVFIDLPSFLAPSWSKQPPCDCLIYQSGDHLLSE
ncbi:hypothetical protein RV10_GL003679 [Enterococcus pallens]|nr:hypothetical protein RV10_GL003679 [Enterococcus pallens]